MVVGDTPVPGDVVYRWSPWRYLAAMVVIGFVATAVPWLTLSLLYSAIAGGSALRSAPGLAVYITIYTIFFPTFSLLYTRSRPAALSFGSDGIELAAERRDAVVVPYGAVTSARVRWMWPVAVLDVVLDPADEWRVFRVDRDGRRPIRKRRGDQLRFSMPIAGLGASTADIRSQLRARHVSRC
ncbi:hypothetical protein ODJ79_11460 [Actinoplanes sp. KI2]|uniref:hypothetical protein n=1 Tax=Actinoplanes sp. KI2 TaxID=2983315 RepID=UPI0021D56AEF|nr:hypothetical protein [Actinoplanes sp. KI2]MCU7724334.1 hypothetical protein [Actinoplanes sp. KI2]